MTHTEWRRRNYLRTLRKAKKKGHKHLRVKIPYKGDLDFLRSYFVIYSSGKLWYDVIL